MSLLLVVSFFIFNNIYLVLIGITIALYQLNKNKLFNLTNMFLTNKTKETKHDRTNSKDNKKKKNYEVESNNSLVEKVEELGYIPSIDDNNEINAA